MFTFPQNDPFFRNPEYIPAFNSNNFAAYDEVDYANGIEGGDKHPDLTTGANRAIDDHPVVQAYIAYHLRKAFGEMI